MSFDLLSLTLNEAWAIHDHVRMPDRYGQEHDPDFMARVMETILDAERSAEKKATMSVTEMECWQIDRQVPAALMAGTQPIGRDLLRKVMALIVKMRREGVDNELDDAGTGQNPCQVPGGSATATDAAG